MVLGPINLAGLDVIARVGVSKVELRCRGESVERDRQSFGGKDIRYRDDLPELGRTPQAVRQVAPELVAARDGPFRQLWEPLVASHGDGEAARTRSRIIAAIVNTVRNRCARPEHRVGGSPYGSPRSRQRQGRARVPVRRRTAGTAGYEIETSSAADFDLLLEDA